MVKRKVIIMGAAGRDFHNFNCLFRNNPEAEVVAFTATQIPDIEGRVYPPSLAGPLYPQGIPIYPEHDLEKVIKQHEVDDVWFSYSDVSHQYVMDKGAHVVAWGANFGICSVQRTMLKSTKPVIAICAVRTGVGQVTDHAVRVEHPQEARQEGRGHAPPDAVRGSGRRRRASGTRSTRTWTGTTAPSRSGRSTSRTSTAASSSMRGWTTR